ncbi:hypothetical protein QTO34_009313 [Cnephaeus nilssonii]|uniref:Myosin motor domain-containing protein n=1 Tax=Cnephaeus nilssonii TaxID=3371016 RepID=A0AA40HHJ1_CNENI|nr:hypothetical protein QTO34_009313 [Eptesicus nilssonii]
MALSVLLSSNPVLKNMWPEGKLSIMEVTKRPLTAATLFKNSMIALVDNLASKEPYYVRCIKPNDKKSPQIFDDERCRHQVEYLGLLENVRVRRAGFAFRQVYEKFLHRPRGFPPFIRALFLVHQVQDDLGIHLAQPRPPFRQRSCEETHRTVWLSGRRGLREDQDFHPHPRTLFTLEELRAQMLVRIVLFLQKVIVRFTDMEEALPRCSQKSVEPFL